MTDETQPTIVEPKHYVPCLHCNWLIKEGELHPCYHPLCLQYHTPESSWPEGGIPPDDNKPIHEYRFD